MKVELAGHYSIPRLIKTSIPMMGMMVVTSIYSIVDGYFVSNYAGSTAFASLNLIWPAIALVSAIGLMIGTGGSALVSKTFGEGNPAKANSIFTTLIKLCLIIGAVAAILMIAFMKPLVIALGADGEMIPLSIKYGRIVSLALPAFIVQMAFQSFYMTAEKPALGTVMSIICGCVNIAGDALLILVCGWGLTGAAIATSAALIIGGIFPICYFKSKKNHTQLQFVEVRKMDWNAVFKSCTNGMSEYVGNIALSIVSICYNLQLMKYIGENGVSAYGILMYVGFIFAAIFIGYNLCVTQVIAFNFGAGNRAELKSLLKKSLLLVGLAGIILTTISEVGAPLIAKLFVGYDPDLCSLTIHALRIYMLSFLLCGFNLFCSAWFTGLNNGLISAIAAFARTLVFELSAVFVLPALIGIDGIWMAVNAAELFAVLLSALLILSFRRKYL